MRTIPKSLAKFQQLIKDRAEELRRIGVENLKQLATQPVEQITVESRPATISVIVQPLPDGRARVVVQGFMKSRFLPGKHVAIDGFYKYPDGTVTAMNKEEFYDCD